MQDRVKYIISLSPENRLTASLLFAIIFLAAGWTATSYNFGQYRNRAENDKADYIRRCAEEQISRNNETMERQARRYDLMDSTANAAKDKLKEIETFLEKKKRHR